MERTEIGLKRYFTVSESIEMNKKNVKSTIKEVEKRLSDIGFKKNWNPLDIIRGYKMKTKKNGEEIKVGLRRTKFLDTYFVGVDVNRSNVKEIPVGFLPNNIDIVLDYIRKVSD